MDVPVILAGRSDCATASAPPCTLVVFGAGGDLTKRLLMPALYNLAGSGLLSEDLTILGLDRLDHTDESWAAALTETMQSFTHDATAEFHAAQIDPRAWNGSGRGSAISRSISRIPRPTRPSAAGFMAMSSSTWRWPRTSSARSSRGSVLPVCSRRKLARTGAS